LVNKYQLYNLQKFVAV